MALITSPTDMIPDLNYEYHTITVDTLNQTSANTWTCFLSQPLKNVVQARLLAARINTVTPANGSEHCYISIDENVVIQLQWSWVSSSYIGHEWFQCRYSVTMELSNY